MQSSKQVSKNVFDEAKHATLDYIRQVLKDAIQHMETEKRETVTTKDIIFSLKMRGKTVHGFD